jgi:hypothetical protein
MVWSEMAITSHVDRKDWRLQFGQGDANIGLAT